MGRSGADVTNHTSEARALTQLEARELVERESQRFVGRPADEAFAMLDRGDLAGTVAGDELEMLRSLLVSQ